MHRSSLTLEAVEALGERLGRLLRPGCLVLLRGEMGAGKTTLTRAVARGLGVDRPSRVCSPTFNICVVHSGPLPLVHIDLFRLAPNAGTVQRPASFEALGFQDLLDQLADEGTGAGPGAELGAAVAVVEWPELGRFKSGGALEVELRRPPGQLELRDVFASAHGAAHGQLLAAWDESSIAPP